MSEEMEPPSDLTAGDVEEADIDVIEIDSDQDD